MNISLTPAWVRGNHVIRTIDADAPGVEPATSLATVGVARQPGDAVGSAVVTFTGVLANSEIRVYAADGTELAGVENCAADQVLTWPAYAPGSPGNTVRIVILSLTQKLKEFQYGAVAGPQNLPIQQEPDKWWSNP